MASKKSSKAAPKASQSKTGFVLAQSKDLSAKEVADKAKAAGLDISAGYVYTIRSKSKTSGGKKKGKPGRPKGSKNAPKAAAMGGPGVGGSLKQLETALLSWVVDHGAHAVQSALHNVSAKLRQLV